jgi:hypothetical protein
MIKHIEMYYISKVFDYDILAEIIREKGITWYLSTDLKNKLLSPEAIQDRISLLGCKFDPSILIFPDANFEDIIN